MAGKVINLPEFDVEDSTVEEKAGYYAIGSGVVKAIEAELKPLKEAIIGESDPEKKTVYEEKGKFKLEVRKVQKKTVDTDALEHLCKKKNIMIGKTDYSIVPRTNNIPQEVLDTLDQYFVLTMSLNVSEKDVSDARDSGIITQKDYEKCVKSDTTTSLYPSVDADFLKGIIGA